MAKRSIGKCRFYADYPSYLKSLGYYKGTFAQGFKDEVSDESVEDVFNMNPSQPVSLPLDYNGSVDSFKIGIKIQDQNEDPNIQLTQLLKQTNYAGLLGHNLANMVGVADEYENVGLRLMIDGFYGENNNESTKIVNFKDVDYNGYSLWETGAFTSDDPSYYKNISIYSIYQAAESAVDYNLKLGAFTFGRYFEPSHSPDLSVKLIKSYEGVDVQTTIGGSTITNFNHLGQPMWGDLPAWTLEKQKGHDYNVGADRGRRTWQVSFSYLSDTDIFNTATNENKLFTWTDTSISDSGDREYQFDTSMASFFLLTHNGNLRFIFCPNTDLKNKEFALCMIDQDSLTYTQVAHRTWNVSMNIMEVW